MIYWNLFVSLFNHLIAQINSVYSFFYCLLQQLQMDFFILNYIYLMFNSYQVMMKSLVIFLLNFYSVVSFKTPILIHSNLLRVFLFIQLTSNSYFPFFDQKYTSEKFMSRSDYGRFHIFHNRFIIFIIPSIWQRTDNFQEIPCLPN